jgi:hypothetical protein
MVQDEMPDPSGQQRAQPEAAPSGEFEARRAAVHPTPLLDQLECGPWPSFVTGLKRLRDAQSKPYAPMMNDLLGQLEQSYTDRLGFWKGGTISVFGYGGGIIPRFSELAERFPASKEFHTLRVQPPAGYHYTTDLLRKLCDVWERHGSGLIALHGQTGDIMFQGCSTESTQKAFDELNEMATCSRQSDSSTTAASSISSRNTNARMLGCDRRERSVLTRSARRHK